MLSLLTRSALSPLLRTPAALTHSLTFTRTLHLSSPRRIDEGKPLTQGHATDKSASPMHKDLDVQSAAVRAGKNAKENADEPGLDAATLSGAKGTSNSTVSPSEGTGALKDQVGGQEVAGSPGKATKTEEAAGGTFGDSVLKVFGSSGKKTPAEKQSLHTSARSSKDPLSVPESPRKPAESNLAGDQNPHLKHKSAKAPDSGKGNAAAKPSLPSKNTDKIKAAKKFSTSAWAGANKAPGGYAKALETEPNAAGYNAPSEALPSTLKSAYGSDVIQPVSPDTKPSNQVQHSSTAVDPPNEALRAAAKEGTLGERNAQPNAEYGRIGLDDAWKERK